MHVHTGRDIVLDINDAGTQDLGQLPKLAAGAARNTL